MAMKSYELASYAVSLIAGVAEREAAARPVATIHIRPRGKKYKNVNVYLRFYRNEAPVPVNRCIGDEDLTYMVAYRFDQLANAVDLLRNERPVFFRYDLDSQTGYLATADGPVGESDRVPNDEKKTRRVPPSGKKRSPKPKAKP